MPTCVPLNFPSNNLNPGNKYTVHYVCRTLLWPQAALATFRSSRWTHKAFQYLYIERRLAGNACSTCFSVNLMTGSAYHSEMSSALAVAPLLRITFVSIDRNFIFTYQTLYRCPLYLHISSDTAHRPSSENGDIKLICQ